MKNITRPNIPIKPVVIFILLNCILSLSGCANLRDQNTYITRTGFYFDTVITINIYDSNNEDILDKCFDMCSYYNNLFSKTVPDSDISKINKAAANEDIPVSAETIEILKYAQKYHTLTTDFDITTEPLCELWKLSGENETLPQDKQIKELLPHINLMNLHINSENLTVSKTDSDLKVDIGALGKGYIADRLKDYMISKGIKSALISLGGNILTVGVKPNGDNFLIGIKKPFSQSNEVVKSLSICDMSVVTSGIYERYFTYDNKIYHHIMDPITGYPKDTDLYSATIISQSSLDGDALSTVCLLSGLKGSINLINKIPDTEAVFITGDNKLYYTDNAQKYFK
ncbi:MAG: FAD:protein FMN transferase [Lachnospiraceae bacterium]|nr:FAD:protein FMN transferase [Lachnospiraceae bacterium]